MIVKLYHTSNQIVMHPNVSLSRKYLDFGIGFYLTPLRQQAIRYGEKFAILGQSATLNTYLLDIDYSTIRYKRFEHYDEDWLNFVTANRRGLPVETYDIVEGGIANDKVFNTIDLYFTGLIDKEETLRRLLPMQPNWQICILNQSILDKNLTYQQSEPL